MLEGVGSLRAALEDGRTTAAELGQAAADDDGWLRAWRAERPADPDDAAVHACALVRLAWKLRGAAFAEYTSEEQAEGFHRVLGGAPEACAEARRLAPGDPVPWIIELWAGIGLGYSREEFDRVWAGVTARDPHHYAAHYAALQYHCAKWYGSAQEAHAFADRAATAAPENSLLAGLRLVALHEHEPDGAEGEHWSTPYARTAVDDARRAVDTARPGDARAAEIRHLLAWCCTITERPVEALNHFRLVDGYVDALPWRYSDTPAASYCHVRAIAAKYAADQLAATA
ncbi:hypothetical protein ABTX81_00590 [Kitasatospora sp. NPDC097605]|uniref:hypothetical protein n=1 Tax=Kitasatospora sp. NPDC097605 TaxID=3157226 RepID=UPI0033251551